MIRQAAGALVIGATVLVHAAQAFAPGDDPGPGTAARSDANAVLGRPVVLSDGRRIGRVASAWPDGPGVMVMQILLDAGAGFDTDALTLIVPGPVDPAQPIRLLLDHPALRDLMETSAR